MHLNLINGAIGNAAVLLIILICAYLNSYNPEIYYRALQEDELLEWASFWAFFIAAIAFTFYAIRQYRKGIKLPWFSAALALFCFVVAMEEISWGQRLLGYRPPVYFLENNFQQELNIHNVFATDLRKLALKVIIVGYGIILPLIALIPLIRLLLQRLGIFPTPIVLLPTFIAAYALYEIYPWKFSGELVELILGLGFLFSSVLIIKISLDSRINNVWHCWLWIIAPTALVLLFGMLTTSISRKQLTADPAVVDAAKTESQALLRDFTALASGKYGFPISRCGYHVRIFKYSNKHDRKQKLKNGFFAKLQNQGLSKERAEFFLDPWNSPYWVRDDCLDDKKRRITVYSFGPDRSRQSLPTKLLGDDIGTELVFKNR
ncbi:MAG: hypothetical protein ACRENO_09365 [Thermodesulfobacteriota bacterium]